MQNSMFGNILPPQMMNDLKGVAAQAIGGMKQMGQMATEAETVMALISAYRNGNLMPAMQQMAQQNPKLQQAMGMMQGQDLNQLAASLAKERGMTVEDVGKGLGLM